MNKLFTKTTLSTIIALSISACGGSGGGVAGIGGSGFISSGSVTGFGSVFVNGVEFETDSATFDVDGESGTQADLGIGMIVKVNGTINDDGITGTATSISFDDELQGPVALLSAPDADGITRSFSVLGIKVFIDSSSTTFDVSGDISPAPVFDFHNIDNNNNVEVSGFFDSNGDIQATRVELKDINFDADSIVEVKGVITGLSGTAFSLDGLSLDIDASAAAIDDLPDGLVNGQFVEVKGTYDIGTNSISAIKVEAEDNSPDDTDEFEIEGIITNYDANTSTFNIGEISVDASNATFEPASLASSLANDTRVEVEGAIINGILIAEEVELEGGDIKVHAMVTAVPPVTAPNTFEVSPVLGEPSIKITVSTDTQLEDDVDELESFTLSDLVVDDFVEVRGFDDGNGGITALEVDVKELSDVIVQGNATEATGNSTGGSITVLGVTFSFDDSTDFEDESDNNLSKTQIETLINTVSSGTSQLVKIKDNEAGTGGNPVGFADEIDLE